MNPADELEQDIAFLGDEDPEQNLAEEERWFYMYAMSFLCIVGRGVLIPYTVYMKMTHKNVTLPLIDSAKNHCRTELEMPELNNENIQLIGCSYLGQQTIENFQKGTTLQ